MSLTKNKIWPGISFSHGVPVPNHGYFPSLARNSSRSLTTRWCTSVPRPVFSRIIPFASPESLLLSPGRNLPLIFLYSAFGGNFHTTTWKKYSCTAQNTFIRKSPCWVVQKSFCYQQWVFPGSGRKVSKKIQ